MRISCIRKEAFILNSTNGPPFVSDKGFMLHTWHIIFFTTKSYRLFLGAKTASLLFSPYNYSSGSNYNQNILENISKLLEIIKNIKQQTFFYTRLNRSALNECNLNVYSWEIFSLFVYRQLSIAIRSVTN